MKVDELNQKYKTWCLSTASNSVVVGDLKALEQCIILILSTKKGSDPLRPNFGTNIFKYLDQPFNKVIPLIIKEIIDAIGEFETRIKILKINPFVVGSELSFEIDYLIPDLDQVERLRYKTNA